MSAKEGENEGLESYGTAQICLRTHHSEKRGERHFRSVCDRSAGSCMRDSCACERQSLQVMAAGTRTGRRTDTCRALHLPESWLLERDNSVRPVRDPIDSGMGPAQTRGESGEGESERGDGRRRWRT